MAEVPEALFGLANALFWLGDLAGTIANCEKAYAGFRRRGDPMFAAGAALALVGYIDALNLDRPLICGFSDGGETTTLVGIRHPGSVRAIVNHGGYAGHDRVLRAS